MRDSDIDAALAQTDWATWKRTPIAGDASARRYFRLYQDGNPPAILMDDPPNGSHATRRFANIAQAITDCGLSAPTIYHHDEGLGMMIIDDLGKVDFAAHLRNHPKDETQLYNAATDTLSYLHGQTFELPLSQITPSVAADMIGLASIHYAPTDADQHRLHDAMFVTYTDIVDPTPHMALRDFHAENLIWRPEQSGFAKVGLLDFQDACLAPFGYDLMSLLRDARRDVHPDVAVTSINRFCAAIKIKPQDATAHLACVSVQRNLRILGIFARLAQQEGKLKYLSLLPRVWTHLMTDLEHPALMSLKKVVLKSLPEPDTITIQRLSAK